MAEKNRFIDYLMDATILATLHVSSPYCRIETGKITAKKTSFTNPGERYLHIMTSNSP